MKPSKGKLILALLGVGCMLLFIGALSLPSLLSTPRGKEWAIARINAHISGHLSIGQWKGSWFGTQSFSDLSLHDASGKEIVRIQHFETATPLFNFFAPRLSLGDTLIENPYLYLATESDEQLNVTQSLTHPTKKRARARPLPYLKGTLNLQGGEILFATQASNPVTISGLQLSYRPDQDLFHFQAQTQQDKIIGEVLISGHLSHNLHLLTKITNFPVALFDQWRGDTLVTTALGETLNGSIDTTAQAGAYSLTLTLASTHLSGTLKAELAKGHLIFHPESELLFNLTPQTFQALLSPTQQQHWSLLHTIPVVLHVEHATLPTAHQHWTQAQCTLTASIVQAEMVHDISGPYTFSQLHAILDFHKHLHGHLTGHILGLDEGQFMIDIDTQPTFSFQMRGQHIPSRLCSLFFEEAEAFTPFLGPTLTLECEGSHSPEHTRAELHILSSLIVLDAHVEGATLQDMEFEAQGKQVLTQQASRLLGNTLDFTLQGKGGVWNQNFAITILEAKAHNEMLSIRLEGHLGTPNTPFNCEGIYLTANGSLLHLPYQENFPQTSLKQGRFSLTLDGKENLLTGLAQLVVAVEGEQERTVSKVSEIEISIKDFICPQHFDFKQATIWANAKLRHFPVTILSLFSPYEGDLPLLIGPTVDADARICYDPNDSDHLAIIDLKATSEALHAELALAIDGTLEVRQPQPSSITLTLTPERYLAWMEAITPHYHSDFTLISTPVIDIALSKFTCPIELPQKFSSLICESGVIGSLHVSPMIFRKGEDIFSVERVQGILEAENFARAVHVNIESELISSAVPSDQRSYIHFVGNLQNLWSHHTTPQGIGINGEIDIHLLPVRHLLSVAPVDLETRQTLSALFGDFLNARIYGDVTAGTGPITIDLKSSNFKTILPLQLTPHALLLRDGIDAEITLTSEVSEILLVDVNPLFITGAISDHPLKLHIDATGFSIAINPFFFKGVTIESAVLDLGSLSIHNGGQVQSLMEFLRATEISTDQWMEAWFTPIFFGIKEGTSYYKRFDLLLAGSVHIAFWGEIDLVKNKVHMTLGIAPSTLAQRFNIKGVSDTAMFQVKMRGKTHDLDLDWSSAYTRIGLLMAKVAGGHIGYILGGVLEQILTVFGEEVTPPPTTTPLPWKGK